MSVDSILKKEGIEIVRSLNTLETNRIAKNISDKISNSFSKYLLNYDDLFSSISRINMYLAKMPSDSAVAKYLYMNNSIYFNDNIDLFVAENSIFALHECIHFIQAKLNDNGKLERLGLYTLGNSGVALNEAAVQIMASIAQDVDFDTVKYYNIHLDTISPDCYPLQCALLTEMLYFTGTYPLYQSTLNSNDIFKNTFISYSDKKTYSKIETNFDKLLKLEDDLYYFTIELENASTDKELKQLNRLMQNRKNAIRKVFFDTQNLIIQNCFTKEFNNISTLDDVKAFQEKIYNFKDVLCYTDNYTFYNEFYRNTMLSLESIREYIEENGDMKEYRTKNTSLTAIDGHNKIVKIFKTIIQKIRKLFGLNKQAQDDIYKFKLD